MEGSEPSTARKLAGFSQCVAGRGVFDSVEEAFDPVAHPVDHQAKARFRAAMNYWRVLGAAPVVSIWRRAKSAAQALSASKAASAGNEFCATYRLDPMPWEG